MIMLPINYDAISLAEIRNQMDRSWFQIEPVPDSRHKRPLSSIVLNPGVNLVADAKDFLKSEKV
jgi:hypothetical protein